MWDWFARKQKPEPVRQPSVGLPPGPDLAVVFGELVGQMEGMTPGKFKGFLMGRRVSDGALAGWLGQNPGAATLEELRGLGRLGGEVGRVALGLVREQSPEPEQTRGDAGVEDWITPVAKAFQVGDYQVASQCMDLAVQQHPNSHQAWAVRGELMGMLGNYEEAIASYEKAIEVKPDKHEAWYNRGISSPGILFASLYPSLFTLE